MIKKFYICSVIIFQLLFGLLAVTSADAVEDISGDWYGVYIRASDINVGEIYVHFRQSGSTLEGTFTATKTVCSSFEDYPISGNINNTISFSASGPCGNFNFSGGGVLLNNISGTFTASDGGRSYSGTFDITKLPTYITTSTAGLGGTVTPVGDISITKETSQTFTIIPNDGYRIRDVTVDGISVGPVSSYTFTNVTSTHTITATFIKKVSIIPILLPLLLD